MCAKTSRDIGLFVGAGFSKWAADLPLVFELFDFEISNIRARDEIWFSKLQREKENWDIQNPHLGNEEFISYIIAKNNVRLGNYLSKYIARRLSERFLCKTYAGIQTFMYDDKKINEVEGLIKITGHRKNGNMQKKH